MQSTPKKSNISSYASYENGGDSQLLIQPMIVDHYIPMMMPETGTTSFGGGGNRGVNSKGYKRNTLSRH